MKALKTAYPEQVYLMAGLHPTHVNDTVEDELIRVEKELNEGYAVAIGEIGIDLYWDTSTLNLQQYAFEKQVNWAHERNLPIVIHCREAFDEIFEVLERLREKGVAVKGILHCFTGTLAQAKRAIDLDLLLGIGGVVTFKNGKIDTFLSEIDIEHIVLETDAPYLAPVPHRGKRNEPSYIYRVAEKVSSCYGLSIEEVSRQTTRNAFELFKVQ
jgi:TatD DNase family protein